MTTNRACQSGLETKTTLSTTATAPDELRRALLALESPKQNDVAEGRANERGKCLTCRPTPLACHRRP